MKANKYILLSLLFIFFLLRQEIQSQEYGLAFNGQKYLQDERTSLNLSSDNFFDVDKQFEMSFYLKIDFKERINQFGYIFRILSKQGKNIDLLLTNFKHNRLILVVGNTETTIPIKIEELGKNQWVKIILNFSISDNQISINISDKGYIKKTVAFKRKESFKIFFGSNNYKEFANSDVPKMSIKDIKLSIDNKLVAHYPLKQCGGEFTYDKIGNKKARIKNPNWLLCNHQNWKLNFSGVIDGEQLIAANEKSGELFLLHNNHLLTYNALNNSFKKLPYKNDTISLTIDHRSLYNENDNKLYCYLVDHKIYSKLNLETGEWSNLIPFDNRPHSQRFQHHNSVFDKEENTLYTLGGYGNYTYNNLINKISLSSGKWKVESKNHPIFKPRYLAGSTILKDSIYLLGGYGSESGSQLANPKSYFNLLAYNTKTNTFTEKFQIEKHLKDMVVAGNMWIQPKTRNYFALIYDKIKFNGYLKLLKGNLDNQKTEILGDSIPYKFHDIKSFANLFYIPNNKKFIAYNSYLNKDNKTEFNIYSIDFPAISAFQINRKTNIFFNKWMFTIFSIISISTLIFFYITKHKKTKQIVSNESKANDENIHDDQSYLDFTPVKRDPNYNITFFGGFQVFNKTNEDITNKFSPLLKELFLLIWLHTFKNNKGISSEKLIEFLWYDKSPRKAQNNRSVNITKLRTLLKEIGGCDVSKDTGYWKINHNYSDVKTDYFELLKITDDKKNITKEQIDHLIKISQKGPFLGNLKYEWLDSFKADVSDRIIETLISYAENFDITEDPDFILNLTDCIFNFDSINEEAVIFKCRAHNYKGNHSSAKSTFSKFQKEYKLLYAQDFEYTFQDILSKDIY